MKIIVVSDIAALLCLKYCTRLSNYVYVLKHFDALHLIVPILPFENSKQIEERIVNRFSGSPKGIAKTVEENIIKQLDGDRKVIIHTETRRY